MPVKIAELTNRRITDCGFDSPKGSDVRKAKVCVFGGGWRCGDQLGNIFVLWNEVSGKLTSQTSCFQWGRVWEPPPTHTHTCTAGIDNNFEPVGYKALATTSNSENSTVFTFSTNTSIWDFPNIQVGPVQTSTYSIYPSHHVTAYMNTDSHWYLSFPTFGVYLPSVQNHAHSRTV